MISPIFLGILWDVLWTTIIILFVIIPLTLLWVFALVDLFRRRDIRWRKVLWLLLIIVVPVLGSVIYLLVRPEAAEEALSP